MVIPLVFPRSPSVSNSQQPAVSNETASSKATSCKESDEETIEEHLGAGLVWDVASFVLQQVLVGTNFAFRHFGSSCYARWGSCAFLRKTNCIAPNFKQINNGPGVQFHVGKHFAKPSSRIWSNNHKLAIIS